jgi:RNA polymerase sigma-70 factor (ECF subfamily)
MPDPAPDTRTGPLVEHLFRRHYARVVAGLVRVLGTAQIDLAEDVAQEALLRALRVWPFQGVPERPEAWLIRVAHNQALDALRRQRIADQRAGALARWAQDATDATDGAAPASEPALDDTLAMMFMCCHPVLPTEARVALTLKTVCGFGVDEIARAFLAKDATVAQRLVRARQTLHDRGVRFEMPGPTDLRTRLDSVLEVVYLLFNEGWHAHAGDALVRDDLVAEALRLVNLLLAEPATRLPKVHALMALMCFLAGRLPARTGAGGDLTTLARQDRSRWDQDLLARGFWHFQQSIGGDELTAWHAEAAIASCHAAARRFEDTDWTAILRHYDQLLELTPTPVVALNRAVAIAKARGIEPALAEIERLAGDPAMTGYHLLWATRAQLLWAVGRGAEAAHDFQHALGLVFSAPERRLVEDRLRRCLDGERADGW